MFRDTVSSDPDCQKTYDEVFPWFLRHILVPAFAHTDKHYARYCALFYNTWPEK